MTHEELLTKISDLGDNCLGIMAGARMSDALSAVVIACQDWENRGSYCIPINEVVDAIKKEMS